MNYIIEIKKLKNCCDKKVNGYIGMDLKTGKLHYYSMYDRNGNFLNGALTEFDESKNIDEKNRLCYKEKDTNTTNMDKINKHVKEIIKMHINHNNKKGFETHTISENSKKTVLKYKSNNSLIENNLYSAKFIPVENTIILPQNSLDEDNDDTLLHEVGHMKVSKVYYKNRMLNIKTGFYTNTIKTNRIKLYNGETFLKVNKVYDNKENVKERIIEEIMNEYDIKQIKPDYKTKYPNIGHILNYLCDYRLEYERYKETGINIIYNNLLKTINDENLIDELFENILELEEYYRWNITPKNNDTVKILKKYATNKKIAKQ